MSAESFKDKNNKFNNGVRAYIARALAGESVLIATDIKPKYRASIKFLDINEELEITEYRLGLVLKRKEKIQ